MFCKHCGQENAINAVRCIRCGEATAPEVASPDPTADSPPRPPAARTESSSATPYGTAGSTVEIGNNLVWAILATLFCCLPTGIVSIVYSAQVNTKLAHGDISGAQESAKNAATWAWVSFGLGLLFMVGYFGLVFLSIAAGN